MEIVLDMILSQIMVSSYIEYNVKVRLGQMKLIQLLSLSVVRLNKQEKE